MINKTEAFTVQCDECGTYLYTSRKKIKLFYSAAEAADEAHDKGWLCHLITEQWLCPSCHDCNRITSYVY